MTGVLEQWTVLPHRGLNEVADGILTVVGAIDTPHGRFPRRMTIVRLSGNRVAIFSAIATEERLMARIEDIGLPCFLIVPNDAHRMDSKIWKRRFLSLQVVTPPGAKAGVAQVIPVDSTEDVLEDAQVRFVVVPGTGGHEAALIVTRGGETTLIVNDVIAHVAQQEGVGAKIIARLLGSGVKAPEMPWVVQRKIVEDAGALAKQFRDWAKLPGLRRIIPSHGEVICNEPAAVLEILAERLEG